MASTITKTLNDTSAAVNERLDDLEHQLPSIPSKVLGLTRAVSDRAGSVVCGAASAIMRQGESIARTTDVAARTTVGQARSATERTAATTNANTREVVGQARAQTGRVADRTQDSIEELLDDATAAVEHDQGRPARLEDLTKAELYERAQDRDIAGRASMSKPQLIKALRAG